MESKSVELVKNYLSVFVLKNWYYCSFIHLVLMMTELHQFDLKNFRWIFLIISAVDFWFHSLLSGINCPAAWQHDDRQYREMFLHASNSGSMLPEHVPSSRCFCMLPDCALISFCLLLRHLVVVNFGVTRVGSLIRWKGLAYLISVLVYLLSTDPHSSHQTYSWMFLPHIFSRYSIAVWVYVWVFVHSSYNNGFEFT